MDWSVCTPLFAVGQIADPEWVRSVQRQGADPNRVLAMQPPCGHLHVFDGESAQVSVP